MVSPLGIFLFLIAAVYTVKFIYMKKNLAKHFLNRLPSEEYANAMKKSKAYAVLFAFFGIITVIYRLTA